MVNLFDSGKILIYRIKYFNILFLHILFFYCVAILPVQVKNGKMSFQTGETKLLMKSSDKSLSCLLASKNEMPLGCSWKILLILPNPERTNSFGNAKVES